MAAYKIPKAVKFVDSIPKNPTGKVLKRLLREEAAGEVVLRKGKASVSSAAATSTSVATAEVVSSPANTSGGVLKGLSNFFKRRV
jgi:long-chain acyl-CoA synthetase